MTFWEIYSFCFQKYTSRAGDWCVRGNGSDVVVKAGAGGGKGEVRPQAELILGASVF